MAGIVSLHAAALHAQSPAPVGVVYQVSQRGEVAYVIASMHGRSPLPVRLSDRVNTVIAWADVVAFESLAPTPAAAAESRAITRRTPDRPPLTEVIPPQLAGRIHDALDRRGVREEQWRRFLDTKLEFAGGALDALAGRLVPRMDDTWTHPGIDMLIHEKAKRTGTHVEELEGSVRQLRMRFTLTQDEAIADLERTVEQMERDPTYSASDARARRLLALLFEGRLDAAYDAFRASTCHGALLRSVCDKTIDARNAYLAARIDQLFGSGRRTVAVIGAMHAAGPNSVLAELRARGYTVREVSPST